jgi:hypothetical protein
VRTLALVAVTALGAFACASTPPPVDLSSGWPSRGGDYDDVTDAWTRQDDFSRDFSMVVDVVATLKSPAWRAAYVEHRAERERMSDAARAELTRAEQAEDAKHLEVELMVATYDRRANDLAKPGGRSIWRVVLVGDDGKEIAPTEIVRDRRPRSEIKAYFDALGDFHQPYVARFPRAALGDGVRALALRVHSAQGGVELVWRDGGG